jgi:hypothetical protein
MNLDWPKIILTGLVALMVLLFAAISVAEWLQNWSLTGLLLVLTFPASIIWCAVAFPLAIHIQYRDKPRSKR